MGGFKECQSLKVFFLNKMALGVILAEAILRDDPDFGGDFSLRGDSTLRTVRLLGMLS